jgi:hypothetical protein
MKRLKIISGFCILLVVIIIVIVYYINKKEGFTASNCIKKNKKKRCLKYECSSRPPGKKWKRCGTKWCTKNRLFYNRDRKKRQEECESIINLPITVYIVNNMDIEWTPLSNPTDESITLTNNITKEQVTKMVDDVNNKFFYKHSIHLVLTIKEYNYSGNEQVLKDLSLLSRSDENENLFELDYTEKHKNERRKLYQDLVQDYSKNSINIYMVTFSGNTRQGYAGVNNNGAFGECEYSDQNGSMQKENYPMIVIGTWSNKQTGKYEPPVDRSTFIEHIDGIPSLSFTFAHEITHILGLDHLRTTVNNIMNAKTSSFNITDQQKQTIIERSKYYRDHFSKCRRHENEDFLLRGVTRNGQVRTKIV